jgi:hypothetical protein
MNIQIPQSIITPFEPLGFPQPYHADDWKIAKIVEALTQAFDDMLWLYTVLPNKTPEEKIFVRMARHHIMRYLKQIATEAGATKVLVGASGDGSNDTIIYHVIFCDHTMKLIQYLE